MRFAALLLLASASAATFAASPATAPGSEVDPRLNGGYKFNEGGWTYVHLQGTPEQIGFQHGYLLAREIEDNVHVYQVEAPHTRQARVELLSRGGGRPVVAAYRAGVPTGVERDCRRPACAGIRAGPLGHCRVQWLHRVEQLLPAVAECQRGKTESAAGGCAGQVQRIYRHWLGNEGREDRDRAQQLVPLCGGRTLDCGLRYRSGKRTALSDGWTAGRDYQPGRFWRERERPDDYRNHAAHGQGIRREWDSGVRPLAQGNAVCHFDR